MAKTTNVTLPTGAKIPLSPFQAGKLRGLALLNPDTGKFDGFGVVAPAAAQHLPTFVTVEGTKVELKSDESKGGNPRVKAHRVSVPGGDLILRITDFGDGDWNYVIQVLPPTKGSKGNKANRKATKSIFA